MLLSYGTEAQLDNLPKYIFIKRKTSAKKNENTNLEWKVQGSGTKHSNNRHMNVSASRQKLSFKDGTEKCCF